MHWMSLARPVLWLALLGAALATADTTRAATTNDPNRVMQIAGLDVAVWLPTGGPGPYPLVLFSHGFRGCKTQSTYLMRALARQGILVVAPDHGDKGARCPVELPGLGELEQFFRTGRNWSAGTYQGRRDDLRKLLNALPADPTLSRWPIDLGRVALVGHSLGGYTVLGLAGAWPSWKTDGIAAIVALAPYAEPFLTDGAVGSIKVPVLLQSGGQDWLTPARVQDAIFAALTASACKVVYREAGHLAWTDRRADFQGATAAATVAFLEEVFAGHRPQEDILASPQTEPPECK